MEIVVAAFRDSKTREAGRRRELWGAGRGILWLKEN